MKERETEDDPVFACSVQGNADGSLNLPCSPVQTGTDNGYLQACKLVLWAPILHAPSSRWMGG
eukprot:1151943-Pelagomonas_calceolata.AAC.3